MELLEKVQEALDDMTGFNLCLTARDYGWQFTQCKDLFCVCGMRFSITIDVYVYNTGWVEYNIGEGHSSALSKKELYNAIKKDGGFSDFRAWKISEDISTAVEGMMESMHAAFGTEFERRLPNVEIVDRTYC